MGCSCLMRESRDGGVKGSLYVDSVNIAFFVPNIMYIKVFQDIHFYITIYNNM